jgi:DNA-binding transcriptional MocR family regulator
MMRNNAVNAAWTGQRSRRDDGLNLYEKLADDIREQIERGVYLPGERIPSVRHTSQYHKLSITTVLRAYVFLESQGVIESRPQSGYFVRQRAVHASASELEAATKSAATAQALDAPAALEALDVSRLVLSTLRSIQSNEAMPLGSPYPDPSRFPEHRITQYANVRARRQGGSGDELPPGNKELIRQIARRYLGNGLPVDAGEIVITVGATEAINLCLQAVAKPGDLIAVETPTFYAMLHAIERMGMRAVEIRTDPDTGIDIDALETALDQQTIAACMLMPNFQNPLGFQMPDAHKRRLVALLAARGIPVIENDVYGELYFGDTYPGALKSYDKQGLVLHCGSFSKTLTAAHRIGWAMPGRYRDQVEKLKFLNSPIMPSVPQIAIAEYLKYDGYDHHLRKVRKAYAQQASIMAAAVTRFFPQGTRVSRPAGGYVLWVELPPAVDAMRLYHGALQRKITIGPGHMFSTGAQYDHFIRLNYSYAWTAELEDAVRTVGRLAAELAQPEH